MALIDILERSGWHFGLRIGKDSTMARCMDGILVSGSLAVSGFCFFFFSSNFFFFFFQHPAAYSVRLERAVTK